MRGCSLMGVPSRSDEGRWMEAQLSSWEHPFRLRYNNDQFQTPVL
jgi:hypothetical protein